MTRPLYLTQEAPTRWWQAGFLKRSLNHITHCRMSWKADSTVVAGQAMQTSTVHPPTAAAIVMNTKKKSFNSKGDGHPKEPESSSVPSDESGKALRKAPLSFCSVAINLAIDTWSATNNILSQFFLTIGRSQDFWRLRSSGKEAPPLAPLQDSTASVSSLVSAMLILERIVSTNSPTELIESSKEGRVISPTFFSIYYNTNCHLFSKLVIFWLNSILERSKPLSCVITANQRWSFNHKLDSFSIAWVGHLNFRTHFSPFWCIQEIQFFIMHYTCNWGPVYHVHVTYCIKFGLNWYFKYFLGKIVI